MRILLPILLILVIWAATGNSQTSGCYQQLSDYSGTEFTFGQLSRLDKAACELIDSLPQVYQDSFAVLDYGFYFHNRAANQRFEEIWQEVITRADSISPYYLLFGRVPGYQDSLKIQVKLPIALMDCFDFDYYRLSLRRSNTINSFEDNLLAIDMLRSTVSDIKCCISKTECAFFYFDNQPIQETSEGGIYNGKFFITFTGEFVYLDLEKADNEVARFHTYSKVSTSRGVWPSIEGCLKTFVIDEDMWVATFYGNGDFAGYRRRLKPNSRKQSNYSAPYEFEQKSINDSVPITIGFNYDKSNCSIETFIFMIETGETISSLDGIGPSAALIDDPPFTIELKTILLESGGGLDGYNGAVLFQDTYFGNSYFAASSITYSPNEIQLCPNLEVLDDELIHSFGQKYSFSVDTEFFLDGSFTQFTSHGAVHWRANPHSMIYEIFVFWPGKGWVYYSPDNTVDYNPVRFFLDASKSVHLSGIDHHIGLAVIGATDIPIASQVADFLDGVIYLFEGEPGEAFISLISTTPFMSVVLKGGTYAIEISKKAAAAFYKGGKLDEVKKIISSQGLGNKLESFRFDNNSQANRFLDLLSDKPDMIKAFDNNVDMVDMWKSLDNYGDAMTEAAWVRLGEKLESSPRLKAFLVESSNQGQRVKAYKYMDELNPNADFSRICN